jgi:hypothetical protein
MSEEMIEKVARALVEADGEEPDAFHTSVDYESDLCLQDHAIPLWRQRPYYEYAKAAVAAYNPNERLREVDLLTGFRGFAIEPVPVSTKGFNPGCDR